MQDDDQILQEIIEEVGDDKNKCDDEIERSDDQHVPDDHGWDESREERNKQHQSDDDIQIWGDPGCKITYYMPTKSRI